MPVSLISGAGACGKPVTRTESRLLFQFAFCPRLPAKKAPSKWSLLVYMMAQTWILWAAICPSCLSTSACRGVNGVLLMAPSMTGFRAGLCPLLPFSFKAGLCPLLPFSFKAGLCPLGFALCCLSAQCWPAGKGPFEVASKELTCALILWGDIQHFPEKLSQPCVAFIQVWSTFDPCLDTTVLALSTLIVRNFECVSQLQAWQLADM